MISWKPMTREPNRTFLNDEFRAFVSKYIMNHTRHQNFPLYLFEESIPVLKEWKDKNPQFKTEINSLIDAIRTYKQIEVW